MTDARLTLYRSVIGVLFASLLPLGAAYARINSAAAADSYSLGKNFYLQGAYPEAAGEFKQCLAVEPGCTECRQYLLLAEEVSGRRDAAMQAAMSEPAEATQSTVPVPPEEPPAPEAAPQTSKGAWTLPKGKWFVEIYNKYYWHDSQFNDQGDEVEWAYNGSYSELSSEVKLEYGLTDRATGLVYLPFKKVQWKDDFGTYTAKGLADFWVGGKYRLFTEPFIASVQGRVKIPGNYNQNHTANLGRRQVDADIKLLLGKNLAPAFKGYTKLEGGFRGRNEEPTNELLYYYELGYNCNRFLTFKGFIDGVEGISGTGDVDEDYTKWVLSTVFKLNRYAIELGYGDTFAGKNTSAAQEIILSLSALF